MCSTGNGRVNKTQLVPHPGKLTAWGNCGEEIEKAKGNYKFIS